MIKAYLTVKDSPTVMEMLLGEDIFVGENPNPPHPLCSIHGDRFWGKLLDWRFIKDYTLKAKSRVELYIEPLEENPEKWLERSNFLEFSPFFEESQLPLSFWGDLSDNQIWELNREEKHIRQEIVKVISPLKKAKVIYDGQCSTGSCIYEVAMAFPDYKCYGSDIRPEMVERAKKVNSSQANVEIFHHNALKPFPKKTDILILRGLSIKVVTREEALEILKNSYNTLKVNGYLLAPAVVPMEIRPKDFEDCGFTVLQTSSWRASEKIRFPFYIAKKKDKSKKKKK